MREEGEKALSWQSPGGALTAFELGNGTWSVPFQGSRADAKQMRGKRSSAVSTARECEHRSIAARNAAACEICSAATKRKGNPPRGISFIFRENLFADAKIFPRGDFAANLSLRAIFAEVLRLPQSPWVTAPSKREPRRAEHARTLRRRQRKQGNSLSHLW